MRKFETQESNFSYGSRAKPFSDYELDDDSDRGAFPELQNNSRIGQRFKELAQVNTSSPSANKVVTMDSPPNLDNFKQQVSLPCEYFLHFH